MASDRVSGEALIALRKESCQLRRASGTGNTTLRIHDDAPRLDQALPQKGRQRQNRCARITPGIRDQLLAEINQLLADQEKIVNKGLAEFNQAVRKAKIPAIFADVP